MPTIALSCVNVSSYPEGGGHFWVYMQYAAGLRELGCDVLWVERFFRSGDERKDASAIAVFRDRMRAFGLEDRYVLYAESVTDSGEITLDYLDRDAYDVEAALGQADALLNFYYRINPMLLAQFRRTALIDIDPGLLQFWMHHGQLDVPPHDDYFTIGETVGTPAALFPDPGIAWKHIRPPICLHHWPYRGDIAGDAYTTVSGWWGGDGKGEWITDGRDLIYENNKRVTFLQYLGLPARVECPLELALSMGTGDPERAESLQTNGWDKARSYPESVTDYRGDAADRHLLEENGWRVRLAAEVAGSPRDYRNYIQTSRGEFSCVKPSCLRFRNAWVSDRSICYLASGRPVVVQDTGPSSFLPSDRGMFRFGSIDEAANAISTIEANYVRESRAARELCEAYFDSRRVLGAMLEELALAP